MSHSNGFDQVHGRHSKVSIQVSGKWQRYCPNSRQPHASTNAGLEREDVILPQPVDDLPHPTKTILATITAFSSKQFIYYGGLDGCTIEVMGLVVANLAELSCWMVILDRVVLHLDDVS